MAFPQQNHCMGSTEKREESKIVFFSSNTFKFMICERQEEKQKRFQASVVSMIIRDERPSLEKG